MYVLVYYISLIDGLSLHNLRTRALDVLCLKFGRQSDARLASN